MRAEKEAYAVSEFSPRDFSYVFSLGYLYDGFMAFKL
jgi:hypothetical protein